VLSGQRREGGEFMTFRGITFGDPFGEIPAKLK